MVAPAYHRHLSLTSIHRSAWKGVLRSSDVGLRTEHGTKNEDEHAYAARDEAHNEAQQEHYHEVQRWISTSDSSLAYILRLCRARCYFWLLSTQPRHNGVLGSTYSPGPTAMGDPPSDRGYLLPPCERSLVASKGYPFLKPPASGAAVVRDVLLVPGRPLRRWPTARRRMRNR